VDAAKGDATAVPVGIAKRAVTAVNEPAIPTRAALRDR
jgi:hypothetical protein